NSSWTHPKKPYRLKLDKKAALLGMNKSKHWVLLAQYNDWMAHGRNYLLFKMSQKMGMPFTCGCIPCEVVLNGDYIGMYFITEQIRVDQNRVNITEQADGETDPEKITGGWLLEIDNYQEVNQIRFPDPKKNNKNIKITYHSPEDLSEEQLNYLTNLMHSVNDAVNTDDKTTTEWEKYIDMDALARFYVLEEVTDNLEAFSGSSWFYKDRGDSTKLIWGPHWDSGSCLGNRNLNNCNFLYLDEAVYAVNHWIGEICKFPRFQVAIRSWWRKYRDEVFPTMQAEVDAYGELTEAALAADFLRWGDKSATQLAYYRRRFIRLLTNKYNFLASHWNDPEEGITLAELMTDGFDGTEYIINDNLAVVNATGNGNRVFVTDGQDHWIQVLANDYYNQLATCGSIGSLRGIFTGKDYIPLLYLTAEPEINEASLTVAPKSHDLNTDFCPIVNEVIRVSGIYNEDSSTLQAANVDDGIALTLDTSWIPNWSVANGKKCIIDGVAQIKEPWPVNETMLNSFEYPYQNFIIYPLEVETPTAISNIEDSIDGNTIINVVNMQGQVIKQGVKRSEATQGLPPGIYLIGNKKVVIRR
ncbi:MAG: CotH kinase family protein, partial [Muribaculaceae bacterium]|nr:CotH kinase family protein [Muribaculaceae bacterium]